MAHSLGMFRNRVALIHAAALYQGVRSRQRWLGNLVYEVPLPHIRNAGVRSAPMEAQGEVASVLRLRLF